MVMQIGKQFWFHAMLNFYGCTINTNYPKVVPDREKRALGLGIITHPSGSSRFREFGRHSFLCEDLAISKKHYT
jgi:hypothetical protein